MDLVERWRAPLDGLPRVLRGNGARLDLAEDQERTGEH
jgi:hypothetical protein